MAFKRYRMLIEDEIFTDVEAEDMLIGKHHLIFFSVAYNLDTFSADFHSEGKKQRLPLLLNS